MKTRTGYLYQRTKGGNYYVRVKIGSKTKGKKTQIVVKSTGTSDKRQAEKRRKEIMILYALGSEADALRSVKSRLEDVETKRILAEQAATPPPELEYIWGAFNASQDRPDSGDSTLKQYHSEWKRFEKWLKKNHKGIIYLHEITEELAKEYAQNLNADKVSASTFNQHLGFLRMLWRVLMKECRLTSNPWKEINRKSTKKEKLPSRKKALTPAQFDNLLSKTKTKPDLHDLFTLLAWTGLRLADAVLMKWGAVDFPNKVITLAPIKTARLGKEVHIPLFPAALEVLNRRQDGLVMNPKGFVFPELAAQYMKDDSSVSKDITAAFAKAGIITTEERAGRARPVVAYGAHSLRHFFVTQATSAGMPAAMIKSITGHSSDDMLEHYQQIGESLANELATRIQGGSVGLLTEGEQTPTPEASNDSGAILKAIRAIVEGMTAKNWKASKADLLKALEGATL